MKEIIVCIVDLEKKMTYMPFLSAALRNKYGNAYPIEINGQGIVYLVSRISSTPSHYTLEKKMLRFLGLVYGSFGFARNKLRHEGTSAHASSLSLRIIHFLEEFLRAN